MKTLIATMGAALDLGVESALRTHAEFYNERLSPRYTMGAWFNDDSVDIELRRFVLSLASHIPFLEDLIGTDTETRFYATDFYHEDVRAAGLGVAFLLGGIALSIMSEASWDRNVISITLEYIDNSDEIQREQQEVVHASRPSHIEQNRAQITGLIKEGVLDGNDLLARRRSLLPSLDFGDDAAATLRELTPAHPAFQQVIKRLFELQRYCDGWHSSAFDRSLMSSKANPESPATLKTYEKDHLFKCPDGQTILFSWHVYVTPGPWRIYFHPQPETKTMIIGHIGRKLPGVDYPKV